MRCIDRLRNGEDINFYQFITAMARGFSPLAFMEDMPEDALIPESIPDTLSAYYRKSMVEKEQKLAGFLKLSMHDKLAGARGDKRELIAKYEKLVRDAVRVRERISPLLEKVKAWTPPSSMHENFQEYMEKQLMDVLRYDGGEAFKESLVGVYKLTPWEMVKSSEATLRGDVVYYRNCVAEQEEKQRSSVEWVSLLRESLEKEK